LFSSFLFDAKFFVALDRNPIPSGKTVEVRDREEGVDNCEGFSFEIWVVAFGRRFGL
jgi:hypothetical protein